MSVGRREFLKNSGVAFLWSCLAPGALAEQHGDRPRKYGPHILMITCHDIGQHLGCYGVPTVHTPHLDQLASKGIRFSNFYSTSPVCSPGRGSLHTGRYPQSNGLMGLTHAPWWWKLRDTERHTASLLKDRGYTPYLIGLNHIDEDAHRLGYEKVLSERLNAAETVNSAIELIQQTTQVHSPFFAKVGFREVHRPFRHGEDTDKGVFIPPWLRDTDEIRQDLTAFQAEIRFFDQQVGRILDALASSAIATDTLVIVTSDHGIPYPGAKWTIRKAGIEVPLILYQPGTILTGGTVFAELISNVDVLPTLLDLLGAPVPANIEGVSFKALLEGRQTRPPRREVFAQYTPDMKRDNLSRSVLTERYHLIRYFDQGRAVDYPVDVHPQRFASHLERCKTRGVRPFAQLYDLKEDPYELNDIGSEEAKQGIVDDLSKRLLRWMKEVKDPLLEGSLRTPYYDLAISDLLIRGAP